MGGGNQLVVLLPGFVGAIRSVNNAECSSRSKDLIRTCTDSQYIGDYSKFFEEKCEGGKNISYYTYNETKMLTNRDL